jgi:uncharacterized protein (DUF305 family)
MKTNVLTALFIGLVAGTAGTAVAMKAKTTTNVTPATSTMAANMSSDGSMPGMDMSTTASSGASMSMTEMTSELKGLSGDEFDKKFIAEMVAHHQGAIDMATLAKAQAKHQEVKDLAGNIIMAQTSEIAQMQAWQKSWGY